MIRRLVTAHCRPFGRPSAAAILVAVCCLMCPVRGADWPAFRGNMERTGYCDETAGFPAKEPQWVTNLGCAIVSSPSIVDGALYIGGRDSSVHAIDATTGKIMWRRKTGGWVDATPLVEKDNIFAGSHDNTIYVLDRQGNDIGSLQAGQQFSSPAVDATGALYSGLGPPHFGMAAYGNYSPKWSETAPEWEVEFGQVTHSSPAIMGQVAVIGSGNGVLYGIDIEKKRGLWQVPTGGGIYLSTPAIDRQTATVFFAPGNYDRQVYAVDILSGKTRWKSEGQERLSLSKRIEESPIPPNLMYNLLRLRPDHRQAVMAEILGRGKTALSKTAVKQYGAGGWSPLGDMKTSSVAIDDEQVYVVQKALGILAADSGGMVDYRYMPQFTLLALDKKTGTEAWRYSEMRQCVRLGYCSSPVATKAAVFAGWGEGFIYAFDRNTGQITWRDTLSGDIISSPAVANGNLYVATMAGDVYCFRLMDTPPGLDFQRSTYCYPNPARGGKSNIQVYVERAGKLSIAVYNMAERPVFQVNTDLRAGQKFTHEWQLDKVANGVYFARINVTYVDGKTDRKTLKIAVLK